MSLIRNGKTYYTVDEVDTMLNESIKRNAKELVIELNEMRKDNEIIYNKSAVCLK